MTDAITRAPVEQAPLPLAQFKRFVAIFHVVFIGGILFCLLLRWRNPGLVWSWPDSALVALVLPQLALYCRFLVFPWSLEIPYRTWGLYFLVSLAIWLAEWQLEPSLQWTAWAYMGQMFGILPPRYSLPASLVVVTAFFGIQLDWKDIQHISIWQWIAGAWGAISFISLGLFLHHLVTTSSDRAKLIGQLQTAQRQLEAARQRDAELAALRERERLARDLHDSLGHGLVTLTVQLEAAQRLYPSDPGKASALLDDMKQLTRTSMEQLRRSLAGLRAPGLGDQKLSAALHALTAERSRDGSLAVQCAIEGQADGLTPAAAEALWRVAQEGLTNVGKHAQASFSRILLVVAAKEAVLRVEDDGVGIADGAELRQGYFGLRGLRERIEGLGGSFQTLKRSPQGSILEARVPIVTQ